MVKNSSIFICLALKEPGFKGEPVMKIASRFFTLLNLTTKVIVNQPLVWDKIRVDKCRILSVGYGL